MVATKLLSRPKDWFESNPIGKMFISGVRMTCYPQGSALKRSLTPTTLDQYNNE